MKQFKIVTILTILTLGATQGYPGAGIESQGDMQNQLKLAMNLHEAERGAAALLSPRPLKTIDEINEDRLSEINEDGLSAEDTWGRLDEEVELKEENIEIREENEKLTNIMREIEYLQKLQALNQRRKRQCLGELDIGFIDDTTAKILKIVNEKFAEQLNNEKANIIESIKSRINSLSEGSQSEINGILDSTEEFNLQKLYKTLRKQLKVQKNSYQRQIVNELLTIVNGKLLRDPAEQIRRCILQKAGYKYSESDKGKPLTLKELKAHFEKVVADLNSAKKLDNARLNRILYQPNSAWKAPERPLNRAERAAKQTAQDIAAAAIQYVEQDPVGVTWEDDEASSLYGDASSVSEPELLAELGDMLDEMGSILGEEEEDEKETQEMGSTNSPGAFEMPDFAGSEVSNILTGSLRAANSSVSTNYSLAPTDFTGSVYQNQSLNIAHRVSPGHDSSESGSGISDQASVVQIGIEAVSGIGEEVSEMSSNPSNDAEVPMPMSRTSSGSTKSQSSVTSSVSLFAFLRAWVRDILNS